MINIALTYQPMASVGTFVLLTALYGCGGGDAMNWNVAAEEARLAESRAKWQAAEVESYTFIFNNGTFRIAGDRTLLLVSVEGQAVTDVVYQIDGMPFDYGRAKIGVEPGTIDQIFDYIESSMSLRPRHLEVSYDPILGFPTEFWYHMDPAIADGDIYIAVDDFVIKE